MRKVERKVVQTLENTGFFGGVTWGGWNGFIMNTQFGKYYVLKKPV